jgi:hypothetical protein
MINPLSLFRSLLLLPLPLLAESSLCKVAKSALSAAVTIRGLRSRGSVPCTLHNKEEVRSYIKRKIEVEYPKVKLDNEEYVMKVLGFIPEDFNYSEEILKLYLSQIGGYYEPTTKSYVMAAWLPEMMQAPIAVHELTHALQDQTFDLKSFYDEKNSASARAALVEGDATAVMSDYGAKLVGGEPLAKLPSVENLIAQQVMGVGVAMGTSSAPTSVKFQLIFPYTSGLRFVHHLLRKDGYRAVNAAFKEPPLSTEQILHPEKYLKEPPVIIPRSSLVSDEKDAYFDTLGEFFISLLLAEHIGDQGMVSEAAKGWGGDTIALESIEKEKILTWVTSWDTQKDATQFLEALNTSLVKRQKIPAAHPTKGFIKHKYTQNKELEIKREGVVVTFRHSEKLLAEN